MACAISLRLLNMYYSRLPVTKESQLRSLLPVPETGFMRWRCGSVNGLKSVRNPL